MQIYVFFNFIVENLFLGMYSQDFTIHLLENISQVELTNFWWVSRICFMSYCAGAGANEWALSLDPGYVAELDQTGAPLSAPGPYPSSGHPQNPLLSCCSGLLL